MKNKKVNYDASNDKSFEERSKGLTIREKDENGVDKIKYYEFNIQIRDEAPLVGKLSRESMQLIYQSYSKDGADLTQRELSRLIPEYTFRDLKRILRAFNITKASAPFAPHFLEENNKEKLVELTLKNKEDNYLKKFELERAKNYENLYKETLKEYREYKENIGGLKSALRLSDKYELTPTIHTDESKYETTLMLHLADMHIGAKVDPNSLYSNEYNYDIVSKRLSDILERVAGINADRIILNLLGDNIDGMDNMTARRDHLLPQNMNNYEQVTAYINIMKSFVEQLLCICQNVEIVSVPCGNHGGSFEYATTGFLLSQLEQLFNIKTTLGTKFFTHYKVYNQDYVICHGKDAYHMKKPLPLQLNSDTRDFIRDWLENEGIQGTNIHVIKGDLHTEGFSSCYKMDYRNVLSLFGSSDYCQMNYNRNESGLSYEIITSDGEILRGAFKNI